MGSEMIGGKTFPKFQHLTDTMYSKLGRINLV